MKIARKGISGRGEENRVINLNTKLITLLLF